VNQVLKFYTEIEYIYLPSIILFFELINQSTIIWNKVLNWVLAIQFNSELLWGLLDPG
jgi:hypothetical protein